MAYCDTYNDNSEDSQPVNNDSEEVNKLIVILWTLLMSMAYQIGISGFRFRNRDCDLFVQKHVPANKKLSLQSCRDFLWCCLPMRQQAYPL